MPRLNTAEYVARREHLRSDWLESAQHFRQLTSEQQWALHDFYLLSHDLPHAEVLARRKIAMKTQPDLMRAAGLAYRSFAALNPRVVARAESESVETPAARKIYIGSGRRSTLRVWVKPNQQTDKELLAEALMLHAQQKAAGYVRPAGPPGVVPIASEVSSED